MSKPKSEKRGAADALLGNTVTIKQRDKDGNLVDKTVTLVPYADLPRRSRRELRNALFKAAPDESSASGKMDLYLASYDAGVIALRAAGATIDPNDESLPAADADALDQTIMLVGLRVLGEMNAGSEGDPKNAETQGESEAPPQTA